MTFRDLVDAFRGRPEILNQILGHLRTFICQRVLSGGDFSQASIRSGTMLLVNQALPILSSAAVCCHCCARVSSVLYILLRLSCLFRRRQVFVPTSTLSPPWPTTSSTVCTTLCRCLESKVCVRTMSGEEKSRKSRFFLWFCDVL